MLLALLDPIYVFICSNDEDGIISCSVMLEVRRAWHLSIAEDINEENVASKVEHFLRCFNKSR